MLEIKGLAKRYATGTQALDGVDFIVLEPQVVAVIGSSGAGKSTLIRCINRLVEPSAGSVVLDGTDIARLSRRALRTARRRRAAWLQRHRQGAGDYPGPVDIGHVYRRH